VPEVQEAMLRAIVLIENRIDFIQYSKTLIDLTILFRFMAASLEMYCWLHNNEKPSIIRTI
jgi:hypothetical protein